MRRALCGLGILVMGVAAGCAPSVPGGRVKFANLAGIYYSATPASPQASRRGATAGKPGVEAEAALVEDSETLLRRAVAQLNVEKNLDFVVLTGDLLARADAASLDRAKAILAELAVPYYVVLGDHDGPAGADDAGALSRTSIVWAFQGHGFDGPEGYWCREVLPGLVLVGLDTAAGGRGKGHIDAKQLEWLDRTLAEHKDKAVLVAAHHGLMALHPLDEGSAWRDLLVDNGEAVRQVLARHANVLAVLTGHHHFADGRVSGRIVYLAAPSVSVWPLAYHLVNLTKTEAEAVWVPLDQGDLVRRAQERLLASAMYRGVFPPGEDGDTACVRLFGGGKMAVVPLPAIRP